MAFLFPTDHYIERRNAEVENMQVIERHTYIYKVERRNEKETITHI